MRKRINSSERTRGFSIVELLVVVAVMGVLASIAVPSYRTAVFRAKVTEVSQVLGATKLGQYAWFLQWNCFARLARTPEGGALPGRGKVPWLSTPGDPTRGRCEDADYSFVDADIRHSSASTYHFYECERRDSPPDFACNAVGDLDGNGDQAEYIFCTDHSGTGFCPASSSGAVSLFPFSLVRMDTGHF